MTARSSKSAIFLNEEHYLLKMKAKNTNHEGVGWVVQQLASQEVQEELLCPCVPDSFQSLQKICQVYILYITSPEVYHIIANYISRWLRNNKMILHDAQFIL